MLRLAVLGVIFPVRARDFLDFAHAIAVGAVSLTPHATTSAPAGTSALACHRTPLALGAVFVAGWGYRLADEQGAVGALVSHGGGLEGEL